MIQNNNIEFEIKNKIGDNTYSLDFPWIIIFYNRIYLLVLELNYFNINKNHK